VSRQEIVRTQLNEFLKTSGIKSNFICNQLGFRTDIFSQWKHGYRSIRVDQLETLDKWLTEHSK